MPKPRRSITAKKAAMRPKREKAKSTRTNQPLKESFSKEGFLESVSNPQGTKERLVIVQGDEDGFTARPEKPDGTGMVDGRLRTSQNAEALARQLAKEGHKKVSFLD